MPNVNSGPLSLSVSDRAKAEAKQTTDWLRSLPFGGDALAERFSETIPGELTALCADISERLASGSNLPRPDPEASLAFAQPAYTHTFTTARGKKRRGQTAGVYVVFYAILQNVSLLRVLSIRHGAAEPLTSFLDTPTGESDE